MQSYDLYRYIFIGGLVLAILMLIITVFLFIFLDIRTVIGALTGSNARKGVENIKIKSSENAKKHKPKAASGNSGGLSPTARISTQDRYDALEPTETSILNDDGGSQTTVLSGGSETTVLSDITEPQVQQAPQNVGADADPYFAVEIDITYVHADEVIR